MERSLINQIISIKAKERAKYKNPISNILTNPDWIKNNIISRRKTAKILFIHPKNRKVYTIPDAEFERLVIHFGVLGLSRKLNCSQSTIRTRCKKLKLSLKVGPRPKMTNTQKYKVRMRKQRMKQTFPSYGTSIEIKLFHELTKRNIKFEKHKPILNLTQPDAFVEPNICIYADGDYWHNLSNVRNKDKYLNRILTQKGYRVYRFWEHEINKNVVACVDQITGDTDGQKIQDTV